MTPFPIEPNTLKTLYANGHITDEGLTAMVSDRPSAIAPITWLAKHYPGLLKHPELALSAITRKPRTCESCIHFSSVHECCMTQIDGKSTYLPVTTQTPACQDFEGVELPAFVNRGEQ